MMSDKSQESNPYDTHPMKGEPIPLNVDPALNFLPSELKYQIVRRIGDGSYGEVYEANAPGGVRVAIKRIPRSDSHPATQSELQALETIKNVSHPFLLQTHAYWLFSDQLIIAMELAEGTLQSRMEHCQSEGLVGVPVEELLTFFGQAAEALDFLHQQKITHRDVKPQNLLYLKKYCKVADFGLARFQNYAEMTLKNMVGTPLYMAPEIWQGKISINSDQYSLAASYVVARIGRSMFDAKSFGDIALSHLSKEPDLGDLPKLEKAVLLKALSKKADDRYPSCTAFVKALQDAVEFPNGKKSKHANRKLTLLVLFSALLLGLILGGIGYRLFNPEAKPLGVEGWVPVESEGVVISNGKEYYKAIKRQIGEENVTAWIVPYSNPDMPPTFYITENKITNHVLASVWQKVNVSQVSAKDQTRLLPGKWKLGALSTEGKNLGIVGPLEAVPVVNVTYPEAYLVARDLGGRVPSWSQWVAATGAYDDSTRTGPSATPLPAFEGYPVDKIALNLDHRSKPPPPWPIATKTSDISKHHIHQLTSNGLEWTRSTQDNKDFDIDSPGFDPMLHVIGAPWTSGVPLTFSQIRVRDNALYKYDISDLNIGFRIVLDPK